MNTGGSEAMDSSDGSQKGSQQILQHQLSSQNNQQQMNQGVSGGMPQVPMVQLSPSQMCKMGQETVQEIVSKTQDLFQILRMTSPPNGTSISSAQNEERRSRINESLKIIQALFKKLRKIHEKVSEATTEMEFIEIESLIPVKTDDNHNNPYSSQLMMRSIFDDKKNSDVVKKLSDEKNGYIERLKVRNRQIKDMIDILREFVWDINAMLAMRK